MSKLDTCAKSDKEAIKRSIMVKEFHFRQRVGTLNVSLLVIFNVERWTKIKCLVICFSFNFQLSL